MIDYIKKLIADYKASVDPNGLPDLYYCTERGYIAGKPEDVVSYSGVVEVRTRSGHSVGVLVSNILFVCAVEPEMESTGM
jgi:hypothetical protein